MDDIKRVTGLALAMRKQANLGAVMFPLTTGAVGAGVGGLGGHTLARLTQDRDAPQEEQDERAREWRNRGMISGGLWGGLGGLKGMMRAAENRKYYNSLSEMPQYQEQIPYNNPSYSQQLETPPEVRDSERDMQEFFRQFNPDTDTSADYNGYI